MTSDFLLWFLRMGYLAKDIPFAVVSISFSWAYLRFYYRIATGTESTVDANSNFAEDFAFVNMFPEVLHPVVGPMSTAFYNLFALTSLVPKAAADKRAQQFKYAHHLR